MASPTFYRLHAAFRGAAAHAGIRPEAGRSAILAAAKAIADMPHGRIDEETTANVGTIAGGVGGTNVVAEHCWFDAEARSLSDAAVETLVAKMVDRCNDAANDPRCECDVDLTVERVFTAYRHRTTAPGVVAAEAALRACNYTPRRILSGGGSDANAFEANGLHCINLANGTERNHETRERVSQVALEGMLDVTFALLDELAEGAGEPRRRAERRPGDADARRPRERRARAARGASACPSPRAAPRRSTTIFARALVAGQAGGGEVRELVGLGGGVERDEGDRRLAAIGVGDAHDAGVVHGGVLAQHELDLGGRHRGALDLDQLLEAVADLELAVVADGHEVAGAQPAVGRL